jgi:hypothetical protein
MMLEEIESYLQQELRKLQGLIEHYHGLIEHYQKQCCEYVLDSERLSGETVKYYKTACGGDFLNWVKENNYKYCPFCGREIKVKK